MQADIQLEAYRTDIAQLAESVFLSMLGLEVTLCGDELPPETEMITGAIYYAGPWKGAVLLQCSRSLAREFTARLMRIPAPADVNDDVRDSIGELTNILGGNLKPILPHGIALSSPSVVEGYPTSLRICGKNPCLRMMFRSELGEFWLSVVGLPD